jgi:glycosyltransferase involved in cell wall biosynthesis
MKVTVVICTWNRADLLEQTLEQMRQLRIPEGVSWELIVVNNNSTDDTQGVLEKYQPFLPLVPLFEARSGKSYAANLAIAHATGDLILWTDDDVLVDPNWLSEHVRAAEQYPDAMFFGGTIDPWFAVEPPAWIRKYLVVRGPYAVHQLDPAVRPFAPDEAPIGANMGMRASLLRQFPFSCKFQTFERQTFRIQPAEEGELLSRIKQAGYHGVWVGTAKVRHYISAERLTAPYVWNWYKSHGRYLVLRDEGSSKLMWGLPRWALRRYVEEMIKIAFWFPFSGERWVRAYTQAARMYGILVETRSRHAQEAKPA